MLTDRLDRVYSKSPQKKLSGKPFITVSEGYLAGHVKKDKVIES